MTNSLMLWDCTAFPLNGRRSRLESVQNANDQARIAAAQRPVLLAFVAKP